MRAVFLCRLRGKNVERRLIYRYEFPREYSAPGYSRDGFSEGIMRVRSDGKLIWIATTEEIICLDSLGKIKGKFDASVGLPEYTSIDNDQISSGVSNRKSHLFEELVPAYRHRDRSTTWALSIMPLENGECLAYGRSGSNLKTWVAKLSFDVKAKPKVKTLLIASRGILSDDENIVELSKNPKNNDILFGIPWIVKMKDPVSPEKNLILIARHWSESWPGEGNAVPLLLDLQTDQIMPVTDRFPELELMTGMFNVKYINGHFVCLKSIGAEPSNHVNLCTFDWNREGRFVANVTQLPHKKQSNYIRLCDYLVPYGNTVYLAGKTWYRIDCSQSGKPDVRQIGYDIIPFDKMMEHYAVTANFGLCGITLCEPFNDCCGHCGELYRFDMNRPMQREYHPAARYVPVDSLEKHVKTATRLNELGAIIEGTENDDCKVMTNGGGSGGQHTMIAIDLQWKGTADDLEKIADLHRPWTMYLYDLTLSDADIATISLLIRKGAVRGLTLVNVGISLEQFKRLDVGNLRMLAFCYDDPAKIPTDQWLDILCYPEKYRLQRAPYLGDIGGLNNVFSPEALKNQQDFIRKTR